MTNFKQLEETISVYGGDMARWPREQVQALRSVLRSDEGTAMLREAGALDAVLDTDALLANSGNDALLTRIMTTTVDADSTGGTSNKSPRVPVAVSRPTSIGIARNQGWIAGGLMAASLLIGVFAGLNGIGATFAPDGLVFVQNGSTERSESADDALLADLTLGSEYELEDDVL